MAIYVVGSSHNLFPEMDSGRTKFIVDEHHEGDNIDRLNPWYCETTALYYMWKHANSTYIGLEHYRRFLTSASSKNRRMTIGEAEFHLQKHQAIVTEYSHGENYCAFQWFIDSNKIGDLTNFIKVNADIADPFSQYLHRHTLIQCNMFIAAKSLIDEYCEWLFPRLARYDEKVGLSDRNLRIDGYIAEHLFGMWLDLRKVDILKVPKVEIRYVQNNGAES